LLILLLLCAAAVAQKKGSVVSSESSSESGDDDDRSFDKDSVTKSKNVKVVPSTKDIVWSKQRGQPEVVPGDESGLTKKAKETKEDKALKKALEEEFFKELEKATITEQGGKMKQLPEDYFYYNEEEMCVGKNNEEMLAGKNNKVDMPDVVMVHNTVQNINVIDSKVTNNVVAEIPVYAPSLSINEPAQPQMIGAAQPQGPPPRLAIDPPRHDMQPPRDQGVKHADQSSEELHEKHDKHEKDHKDTMVPTLLAISVNLTDVIVSGFCLLLVFWILKKMFNYYVSRKAGQPPVYKVEDGIKKVLP